ncbi:MAG: hypothetical protein DRJ60_00345 [Thermoprotei archaeon]|nr:MAG: hypothetical protein DRJ60_00345 [Thermoprotei archaeon]
MKDGIALVLATLVFSSGLAFIASLIKEFKLKALATAVCMLGSLIIAYILMIVGLMVVLP